MQKTNVKIILSIFGTRPEAIKMAPVIKALEANPDQFRSVVCVTGQHRLMLDQVLELFAIRPDFDLKVMKQGQDLFDITNSVLHGLKDVLEKVRPSMVLVHGDTATTMAASLAAYFCRIPVGHVEAGLRTGNKYAPFPEEINRRVAGVVADLHFAPTETSRQNLLREGVDDKTIVVTGNTVIDALLMSVSRIKTEQYVGKYLKLATDSTRIVLVTAHRRENFGSGFENLCMALKDIADKYSDVVIVYPVHLNPNVQEPVQRILFGHPRVHLTEPLEYLPFVFLMNKSFMVITDSGGVQEEAPALGKPVLVVRDTTERLEAVDAGTVRIVGTTRERIAAEAMCLLDDPKAYEAMATARNPYGDGQASKRIINSILLNANN